MVEGGPLIVNGNLNAALNVKINFIGTGGWELVTVYSEGGQEIFIYKRQL